MNVPTRAAAVPLEFPSLAVEPFWLALQDERLVLQRCARCGTIRHYPRPLCDRCYASETELMPAAGDGVLHTWTTVCRAFHPAFESMVPYTVCLVDLPEGVRVMGHLHEVEPAGLRIGVALRFVPLRIAAGYRVAGFALRRC